MQTISSVYLLLCTILACGLFSLIHGSEHRPVAHINGQILTVRDLEDALLRREGTEQLIKLVEQRLKNAKWESIDDQQVVLALPGGVVRRADIALSALEEHGAKTRNELVTMMATQQAIKHAGIIIDRALVDAEVAREQRRFIEKLERSGQPIMPFEQAVLAKEGITIREWRKSDAVRLAAGLHELALRIVQVDPELIKEHYAKQPERFEQREAIQLQVIYIPYRRINLGGQDMPDPKHMRSLRSVMGEIYFNILDGKQSFERMWNVWGAGYDQIAEDGHVGWVHRDGHTSKAGVQTIPPEVIAKAFDANLDNGPQLLEPIATADGIRIVKALAYQPTVKQSFDEIKDAVRRDLVELDLERYTRQVLNDIIDQADIRMESWSELISKRRVDAAELRKQAPSEGDLAE